MLMGLAAAAVALAAAGGWLLWRGSAGGERTAAAPAAPTFVGSAACGRCHAEPFAK